MEHEVPHLLHFLEPGLSSEEDPVQSQGQVQEGLNFGEIELKRHSTEPETLKET